MKITRILVPLDFSDPSQQALDYAAEMARQFDAELVLLHVIEPLHYASMADVYGPASNIGMLTEECKQAAGGRLEEIGDELEARQVRSRTILGEGPAYDVIVKMAVESKCELIVMATHGRTGLSHVLMGSVAERVVRLATCPVLTVRGREG